MFQDLGGSVRALLLGTVSPPFISFKPAPVAGLAFLPCQPLPQFGYSQCLSGEDSLLGAGNLGKLPHSGPSPIS